MLLFVVPEIILGTSLFILLTTLLKFVDLGTGTDSGWRCSRSATRP